MAPVLGRGWLGSPCVPPPQIATGFVCQGQHGHSTQPSIPALGWGSTQIWGGLNVQGVLCHPRDRGGPAAELAQPAAEARAAFWRCHVDRAAQPMGVRARRGLWCSPDTGGWMGRERRYPHPSRQEVPETHPGSVGTSPWCPLSRTGLAGAGGRERREPEDEAAAMGDGTEEGCGGGGGGCLHGSTHGMYVPAPPCFSLTQSPSQGRHKDTFPTVHACRSFSHQPRAFRQGQDRDQLVPQCPAWARSPAARPDAGSSQQVPKPPCFPLHLPRDGGYTLLTRGFQPQHHQVAPSSTHPCRSIPAHIQPLSNTGPDPQGQHWVLCRGGIGCRLPPPSLGSRWGCQLYLELHTNKQQRYLK